MKNNVIVKRYQYPDNTHEILDCIDTKVEKKPYGVKLTYKEKNEQGTAEVEVIAKEHSIRIHRTQEHVSQFLFLPQQVSSGKIMTNMGLIPVQFYTHRYIKKDNVITLEYEVRQGDDTIDRFTFLWSMKGE